MKSKWSTVFFFKKSHQEVILWIPGDPLRVLRHQREPHVRPKLRRSPSSRHQRNQEQLQLLGSRHIQAGGLCPVRNAFQYTYFWFGTNCVALWRYSCIDSDKSIMDSSSAFSSSVDVTCGADGVWSRDDLNGLACVSECRFTVKRIFFKKVLFSYSKLNKTVSYCTLTGVRLKSLYWLLW